MRCIIIFVMTIILISAVQASTLTLHMERYDTNLSAYSFEREEFAIYDEADITFVGSRNMAEGLDRPRLYTDNMDGRIILKDGSCLVDFGENREQEIVVGQEYCVKSMSENMTIQLRVIDLSEDWTDVTIEYSEYHEVTDSTDSTDSTTKKGIKPIWIIVDILLVLLIGVAIWRIIHEKGTDFD